MTKLPEHLAGRLFNPLHKNCPCDALEGPCSCGAWHRDDELEGRIAASKAAGLWHTRSNYIGE